MSGEVVTPGPERLASRALHGRTHRGDPPHLPLLTVLLATSVAHAAVAMFTLGGAARVLAAMLAVGLALIVPRLYPGARRATRVAVLAGMGLVTAGPGLATHGPRLFLGEPELLDLTGALVGLAGLAAVLSAARYALADHRRRWKLLYLPLGLLFLQVYAMPMLMAGMAINASRGDSFRASSLGLAGARDVSFQAADGVTLRAWYVPGRNGAAVVVAHGAHNTRSDTAEHVRMLAGLGYGVLAFDARGHGASGGDTNAFGWQGADDLAGAVDFIRQQRGIVANRIAALGLSMGGESALRAAAAGAPFAAIVADGAGASTAGDAELAGGGALEKAVSWLGYRATEALSGDTEPASLASRVSHIEVPVLLIASGAKSELTIDRHFAQRIGSQAHLWHVADAGHLEALQRHPDAYASRVAAFLRASLDVEANGLRADR